jgi:PAS domain S-box-containing protein
MPYLSMLNFFSAIAYGYLAVFLLVKNHRHPLNRICSAVFFCFLLWSVGKTFAHNPHATPEEAFRFMKLTIVGAWSFSSFLLWFAFIVSEKKSVMEKIWFYPLLFAVPLTTILVQWIDGSILVYVRRPFGWGLQWNKTWLTFVLLGYIFGTIVAAIILILVFSRKTGHPAKKKQARILGLSTLLAFFVGYITNIIAPRISSVPIPDLAHNMALVWAIGIVYVILKYNFLAITPATAARNIISTMADALILTNEKGRIVGVNQSACALLDGEEDLLRGVSIEEFITHENDTTLSIGHLIEQGILKSCDFDIRNRSGKRIPVSLSSSVLTGKEQTLSGLIIIARDISEKKAAERELQRSRQKAEEASRAKSAFLANMSHELRTPLNHIIGFSELLVDRVCGPLTETQAEYLDDMLESSHHLLSLINDVLDLAKVESGKLKLNPTEMLLEPFLRESLSMVNDQIIKRAITVEFNIDQLPEILLADMRKLKQIMYNLLSNAVKFTPDKGRIIIACQFIPGGDDRHDAPGSNNQAVQISVRDTGVGIAGKDLARIFNPFEQVDNSTRRNYPGTGLGLPLTRSLVELHGGSMRAESDGPGRGATFSFTIPTGVV